MSFLIKAYIMKHTHKRQSSVAPGNLPVAFKTCEEHYSATAIFLAHLNEIQVAEIKHLEIIKIDK